MIGRRALSPVLVALLLAGCGTTVHDAGDAGVRRGDALTSGTGVPGAADPTGPAGAVVPGGRTAPPAGTTAEQLSAPQQLTVSGTSSGGAAPGAAGAAVSGLGVTKDTVQIGYATADDSNAFAGSLGIKGVTVSGDPRAQIKAVVDDINKRGGLAGRKIVLGGHDYNTVQTHNDPGTANQAACADWTEDHHVFAVVGAPIVEETLLSCLAKARTPLVNAGGLDFPTPYDETFAKHPLFFDVAQMSGDLHDRIAVDRLVARKFFAPWDTLNGKPGAPTSPMKLGLLMYDDHPGDLQLASYLRQLKRHGITVSPTDVVKCPRPVSGTISCQHSAVLKMASDGVTHIFGAGLIFLEQAESQRYRPRYYFAVEPRVIAENAPAAQLVGSMGESNLPVMDVEPSEYPGDPSPASAYCRKIMRGAGQTATDPTTLWAEYSLCDELYALEAAVKLVGVLGPEAVRTGFERIGTGLPSALTWQSRFGPGQHGSSSVLRDVAFDEATSRFVYVDKVNRA